ncbi:MAG: PH domain-containing protein [Gemmataceae bacterium]|nr:PH domain-containing protein [Gemmataceae bacterium]
MSSMVDVRKQAVTGLVPPQQGEALIRVAWPAVTAIPPVATLGRKLICSIILAPLGWGLMLPFYFKKILPFIATRYTLTNRRIMIQRGLKPKASAEVALTDIDEVRVIPDGNSEFFRASTVEVLSKGQVKLTLPGVPEPEAFKHAIVNACMAWVPGREKTWLTFVPAKA